MAHMGLHASLWEGKQSVLMRERRARPGRLRLLCNDWVAVKELKLRDYPPIMENQLEKKMENEMESG